VLYAHRFLCRLFSWRYKSLFRQLLCFHINQKPRGVRGQLGRNPTSERDSERGKPDDLHRLHADFALLHRAKLPNPGDLTPDRAQGVFVQDQFNRLPDLKPEIHAESEATLCSVDDKTRHPRLASMQIEDQAGALLRRNPFISAAFGTRGNGHRAALSV
jgi:hypothetical protein